jgi:predicted secreted protein
MSSGIGIIGREVTVTVGAATILGVLSKSLSFNNTPLDTTDDQSDGWQERLAIAGRKSVEFGLSGQVKNLDLVAAYFGESQLFAVSVAYPDGSTLTFDAFMDSFSHSGAEGELTTFEATFSSSGEPVFTAAT